MNNGVNPALEKALESREKTFYDMRNDVGRKEPRINGSWGNDDLLSKKTEELLQLLEESEFIDTMIKNSAGIENLNESVTFRYSHVIFRTLDKIKELRTTMDTEKLLSHKEELLALLREDSLSSLKVMR